jgi:hypothetical protein
MIADNALLPSLGDLSALESVSTATITANPLLPQCEVDAIAPLVGECACDENGPCVE